jgi:hypothetical protein
MTKKASVILPALMYFFAVELPPRLWPTLPGGSLELLELSLDILFTSNCLDVVTDKLFDGGAHLAGPLARFCEAFVADGEREVHEHRQRVCGFRINMPEGAFELGWR